ncbi:MAG: 3-hydroxyacyl-CoA dehydrogenase family protein [Candidatus Tectomicrobia bacterium]|nr:3-hydroxyacyl-CoA dehydrogenase family protein [Candidatus Tectomicrobia bacterium]
MNIDDIRRIGVVGAGLMGHGIAQEFALAGYDVRLHDLSEDKLQQATKSIHSNLHMLTEIGLVSHEQAEPILKRIHSSTILPDVVAEADIVIEAIFEDLALKQKMFQALDQLCPSRTILASNTSTLLPSQLAAATQRPDKVLVAHYFNPPYLLPLVEVVRGEETSDATITIVSELLTRVGKRPAIVQKEAPGFIGNRLQTALLREALSIVQQGIARPQDVDIVIKNGFGRRLAAVGVFESYEMAGWDLILAVMANLLTEIESSSEISPLLSQKIERGELGIKTGKGFYDWTPESAEVLQQRVAHALIKIAQWS